MTGNVGSPAVRRLLLVVGVVLAALTLGFGLPDNTIGSTRSRPAVVLTGPGLAARGDRYNAFGPDPDTTGAIGPLHYLETVKSRLALFDRRTLREVAARDAERVLGVAASAGQRDGSPGVVGSGCATVVFAAALVTPPAGTA